MTREIMDVPSGLVAGDESLSEAIGVKDSSTELAQQVLPLSDNGLKQPSKAEGKGAPSRDRSTNGMATLPDERTMQGRFNTIVITGHA
jgi:hypothetical protein